MRHPISKNLPLRIPVEIALWVQTILKVKPFSSYCLSSLVSTSSNRSLSTGLLSLQHSLFCLQGTQHNQEGGKKTSKQFRINFLVASLLNSLKVCTMISSISRYSLSVITPAIFKSRGMFFSKPFHLTSTLNVRRLCRRMACEAFGAFFRRGVFSLKVMSTALKVMSGAGGHGGGGGLRTAGKAEVCQRPDHACTRWPHPA